MSHTLDPDRLGRHLPRLHRSAFALCGSHHEADDLVQETLARLLSRPRWIRDDDELGYVLTALRNTFLTQRRTAARRPREVELPDGFERADCHGEAPTHCQVQARQVLRHVEALPRDLRAAVTAVDVMELSPRQAASALRVDERTLRHRLQRARRSLAPRLTPPAVALAR